MGLVIFDERDANNLVTGQYSTGRGQVLRSDHVELTKVTFEKGRGADTHQHPEEQIVYILEGAMQVTLGDKTYVVQAGQASYHPPNIPHSTVAKTDVVALSFKRLVDPVYHKTGDLK